MMKTIFVCCLSLLSVSGLLAQSAANPFTSMVTTSWQGLKKNLTASAALVPEAEYGFKPTPQVRSFGQIVGHLANDHFLMCSAAKGEKNPNAVDYEKTTNKAELVKALAASVAYCDAAYTSMTDAAALQPIEAFGRKFTRLGMLELNVTHGSEHYGNLVTYMRLKGLVPPSSAGQ
jgi:uncharacterized damage-inducible protein DinB